MPTLKDIANLAGVSYGTVSNVINKKGNVSLEKIKLVEDAAKKLGYYKNPNASTLRANRKQEISLIIPSVEEYDYNRLYSLLNIKLKTSDLKLSLYVTNYNPLLEQNYVDLSISSSTHVIIIPSSNNLFEFYNKKTLKETKLIFINSPFVINNENIYNLTYDYNKIFNDVINYASSNDLKNILFFAEDHYNNYLTTNNANIKTCSYPYNLSKAIEILSEDNYDLIFASSYEKYLSLLDAKKYLLKEKSDKIILFSPAKHIQTNNTLIYNKDISFFVERVFDIITGLEHNNSISFKSDGVIGENEQIKTDEVLNILLVESPSSSALIQITPYFEKVLNFKINIDLINYNDYHLLENDDYFKKYDLIRIDMANLPYLAKSIYKPMNDKFKSLFNKFIDNLDEYMYYDNTLYSLPFDIGSMILMYRSDIFNNQFIKRQYLEETKTELKVPQTYNEFNKIENFITKYYKNIFSPSTLCFGGNITTGNEFILRVNDKREEILNEDGELNLNNKCVVEALDSYKTSLSNTLNKNNRFWDQVAKEYSKGNVLMSIIYSNYINHIKEGNNETFFKTNFVFPPNRRSLIGGGAIGLTKHTKKDELGYQFLKALYSDEISKLLTHLGATLPVKSIYEDITLLHLFPWLELIPNLIDNNKRHINTNLTNTIEHEKEIGRKVRAHFNNY